MQIKILILTYGSTGDVVPYLALGKGLAARGHQVTICTNSRFEGLITRHGLAYAYMSDEITQLIESAMGRGILEGLTNVVGFCKAVIKLTRKLGPLQAGIVQDTWTAAEHLKPDVILFSPKNHIAVHFSEKLNCQAIAAPLFPQYVPTGEYPTLGFPALIKSPGYNRFTYRFVRSLSNLIGGKQIKMWREEHGLAPAFCGIDICHDAAGNNIPVINGYSPALIPDSADCPANVHTCGFWFLNQESHWSPPESLLEFLNKGEPPLYVGFGSMASTNAKKITRIVVNAIEASGARAIIATGWGGLELENLPDSILKVTDVPHDWLFPRVSAVIHHGGAGTTAAGLKAGRPTLICSFFGDQILWGRVVHELGAGPAPIPQKKLTEKNLSDAITTLLNNTSIKQKALELSAQMNQEDGIAGAAAVIEAAVLEKVKV